MITYAKQEWKFDHMSKKKAKWIVSWWDDDKECEVHKLFEDYESAMTKQFRLKKQGIYATVSLK